MSQESKDRLAKVIARAGICSRRAAEVLIQDGRVTVNDAPVTTPAFTVSTVDRITIDGTLLPPAEAPRLWLFHKPNGVVTTHHDPQRRPTLFDCLPKNRPAHLMAVGRLDLTSEGLILLTNDGELARTLEHPSSQIPRTYHVRVFGVIEPLTLNTLAHGITIEGIHYGPITWKELSRTRTNQWLELTLTEGKNREIRTIIQHLGSKVSRLIRTSYGPFILGTLKAGEWVEVEPEQIKKFL
jgi:23S rRNA pseudouridine2605 synthase